MINTRKGVLFKFIAKNYIVGEWEISRDKAIGIEGNFLKNNWRGKNSEDKESRFHTLPAGKKEKLYHGFVNEDDDVFDYNYMVPTKYQYHESNNGQCMLYALLLLIHIDDADLASRLLMKSKEK